MHTAWLLLGTNLGNRRRNLFRAAALLQERIGRVVLRSSRYASEPWGFRSRRDFLNQVICLETGLDPEGLLTGVLEIESALGRTRKEVKYESRIIDIDILFYDSLALETESLVIPHPMIPFRRFTLVPLAEVAPGLVHPLLNLPVSVLLERCQDTLKVRKIK